MHSSLEIRNENQELSLQDRVDTACCCKVCEGRLSVDIREVLDEHLGQSFSIARCLQCGLGHTLPVPQDLSLYYKKTYYGNRHGVTSNWCDRRRLGFVRSLRPAPGTLLDVGCGEGTFLITAKNAGWKVFGNELNPEPARSKGLDVSSGFGAGPYDCITLWHSLEHMAEPLQTLSSLRGLLAPGGLLIASVPNAGSVQARLFRSKWLHLDVPRHLMHYDDRSFSLLFEKAGFITQRKWFQEIEYDLLGALQSALNCVLPRQNILFKSLTGQPTGVGKLGLVWNYVLAASLSLAVAPLAWRGCLIFAGRRPQ